MVDFDDHIGREATLALFDRMRCVPWVNLFGLPALALPSGIQLIARRFHEADLFDSAYALEPHLSVARRGARVTRGPRVLRGRSAARGIRRPRRM